MFNKGFRIVVLALFAALLSVGSAFAQSPASDLPQRGGRRGVGQILHLEADALTVQGRDGAEIRLLIDKDTRFHALDLSPLEYNDLQTGDWVVATAVLDGSGGWAARVVVLLPPDYDVSQRIGIKAIGRVNSINRDSLSLQVSNRDGESVEFLVNEHTRYRGEVASLEELQEGMGVAVAGIRQLDGQFLAVLVAGRQIRRSFAGEVIDVDPEEAAFTLQPRNGESAVQIAVDAATVFRSRAAAIASLDDLQPGDLVAVQALEESDGDLLAERILSIKPDQLLELDLRVTGFVQVVAENSIQIESPDGEIYTIVITESTRLRVPGPRFGVMPDLHPGMRVGVAARQLGSGEFEAVALFRLRNLP